MGADGRLWRGQSPALSPVVNDFTEAGTIALEADGEPFDRDLGQPVAVAPGNPSVTQLQLPFAFYGGGLYARTVGSVHVNAAGYLTLAPRCVRADFRPGAGATSSTNGSCSLSADGSLAPRPAAEALTFNPGRCQVMIGRRCLLTLCVALLVSSSAASAARPPPRRRPASARARASKSRPRASTLRSSGCVVKSRPA